MGFAEDPIAAGRVVPRVCLRRGFDSTTAYSHVTAASIKHAATAMEFREANTYINTAKTWGNLKDGR